MAMLKILPNMKFTLKQKELLITQIIDNVELFGKPTTIAENLSYLIH